MVPITLHASWGRGERGYIHNMKCETESAKSHTHTQTHTHTHTHSSFKGHFQETRVSWFLLGKQAVVKQEVFTSRMPFSSPNQHVTALKDDNVPDQGRGSMLPPCSQNRSGSLVVAWHDFEGASFCNNNSFPVLEKACYTTKVQNQQHMKYAIKTRKLISVSKQMKTDIMQNANDSAKPASNWL